MPANTPEDRLQHIIQYAVKNGWQPVGHDGRNRTAVETNPKLLEFTPAQLVETQAFQALFLEKTFLVAIFGELLWDKILLNLVSLDQPHLKIQYVYTYIVNTELEYADQIDLSDLMRVIAENSDTQNRPQHHALERLIRRSNWHTPSNKLDPNVEALILTSDTAVEFKARLIKLGLDWPDSFGDIRFAMVKEAIIICRQE
jgi:hypothetical protein